jgi:hypothetical protein
MRGAELEIRLALEKKPGQALACLLEAYNGRDEQEREVFAIAAFSQLVSAKALENLSLT